MNTNKVYESLDITDNFCTYFENAEEWTEFYCRILEEFENLENRGYTDICFDISSERYSEYGDEYSDVKLRFNYTREVTPEERAEEQKEKAKDEEDSKIFSELCGKLSTNSIGSILHNEDLRELYLSGKILI